MSLKSSLRGCVAAAVVSASTVSAVGQSGDSAGRRWIDEANSTYSDVRQDARSDVVLLPALAAMDEPPGAVESIRRAMLLTPSDPSWAEALAWATGGPQQAAIGQLLAATGAGGSRLFFAQPYGRAGVSEELIDAGLYTDLGGLDGAPETLASASFGYLPGIDRLVRAAQIEATRLVFEGETASAIELMISVAVLGRQLCDRAFVLETVAGYDLMSAAFIRIRDLAWLDLAQDGRIELTPSEVIDFCERLPPERGLIDLGRLRLPEGDRLAAMQTIELVYAGERIDVDEYVALATSIASRERPLRRFAAASEASERAGLQVSKSQATEQLENMYNDFRTRWTLGWHEPLTSTPFAFESQDEERVDTVFRSIAGGLGPSAMIRVLAGRQMLIAERSGTRLALAVLGRRAESGFYPPALSGVRPRFVREVDEDPYNPDRPIGRTPEPVFAVIARDLRATGDRDRVFEPGDAHRFVVHAADGTVFRTDVGGDHFLLYSLGDDARDGYGLVMTEGFGQVPGDMLLWPPVISLQRDAEF